VLVIFKLLVCCIFQSGCVLYCYAIFTYNCTYNFIFLCMMRLVLTVKYFVFM